MIEPSLLLTLAVLAQADAQEEEPPPPLPNSMVWTWTKKQESRLRKIEREVVKGADDRFRQKETSYAVDTYGSPRLAAEIGLFLEVFEESVLEVLDADRRYSAQPTVKLFDNRAEFQKAAPMSAGARLVYEAIPEPKGKTKHRIKILANDLFAYVENNEKPTFNDLPLADLRAEGARAVLVGVLGRPNVSAWFEEGVCRWFSTWDPREKKKLAFAGRLARSEGMTTIIASMKNARTGWRPSLENLTRISPTSWPGRGLSSEATNEQWSESVIDALMTAKGAKSTREDLIEEFVRIGLAKTSHALHDPKDITSIEKIWLRHLDGLAPKADSK